MKPFLILLLLLFCTSLLGANNIIIDSSFKEMRITDQAYYYEHSGGDVDINEIIASDNKEWTKVAEGGFYSAKNENGFWFKFNIDCNHTGNYYLSNEFIHTDRYHLYQKSDQTIVKKTFYETAEGKYAIKYPYPSFQLSLIKGIHYTIYLYAYNKKAPLKIPLKLYDEIRFINLVSLSGISSGIIYGLLLLLILIAAIISFLFRQKAYFLYIVHLLSVVVFILSVTGMGYMLIWKDYPLVQGLVSYFSVLLSIVILGVIAVDVLSVKLLMPKLYKFLIYLISYYLFITISLSLTFIWLPTLELTTINNLAINSILLLPLFVLYICFKIYAINKNKLAIYFFLIFLFSFGSMIVFSIGNLGIIPHNTIEYFIWFYPIEGVLLLIVFVRDVYHSKLQKIELQSELITQKEASALVFIKGQANERKRLSRQLHDSIGMKLAGIKMDLSTDTINTKKSSKLINDLDRISEEVRHISHALNPASLERQGVVHSIEEEICRMEGLYPELVIHFDYQVENLNMEQQKMIYWTFLELLNNIIKYAEATEVKINLIKDIGIRFVIQDNGKGYDPSQINSNGIGLLNIEERAQLVGGEFTISSLENGMKHCFEIP